MSSPVGAVLADTRALGTIVDDEAPLVPPTAPPPTLSIGDVTIGERGPPGTGAFTVSLSAPAGGTVSVKAATANGTALAGFDYTALPPTTVTFAPGETSKNVSVAVTADSVPEGKETFVVNLSGPAGAVLADAQAVGTIADDEGPPSVSIGNATAGEEAGSATFTISLSAPAPRTVSVRAVTANGSAIAGSDYTALPLTTVSFAPGETAKTVSVAVTGDSVAEGNGTFVVNLSGAVGAVVADPQGVATIADDEGAPTISISNATVAVTGDVVAEGDETFVVNLSAPVGAVLADPAGAGHDRERRLSSPGGSPPTDS